MWWLVRRRSLWWLVISINSKGEEKMNKGEKIVKINLETLELLEEQNTPGALGLVCGGSCGGIFCGGGCSGF